MHRIVITKKNTQQKKPLKFPEMSAVLNFSHVFSDATHPMSASQKFVIDRLCHPSFFEVKELIAEAEVQIQEAVFSAAWWSQE